MTGSILDAAFLKKLERLSLASRRPFAGQMKGEKRSTKRGSSVEFADYREYQYGDDLRYVDWNTAARLEKLYVKLFVEEEDLYLALLIDTSRSMEFGSPRKLTQAAQIAAAIGYIGLTNYDRVSVGAFDSGLKESMPTRRGKSGIVPFFKYLEGLKPEGKTSFADALKLFAGRSKQRGIAVVLSDFMGPHWQDGVRSLLSRGFQVAMVQVLDSEELRPTLVGDLNVIDCETLESKEMSINPALLQRYQGALADFQAEIDTFANRYGCDFVTVSTSTPVEDVILKYLRQGGLVR
ncbi:MAG: DUF58 domain-containing protein [Chthonomonadales bacterium]